MPLAFLNISAIYFIKQCVTSSIIMTVICLVLRKW
ncbi:exopolysaccharide production repressor protein [Bacteroides caecimuris]